MKVVGIGPLKKGTYNGYEYESRSLYCTYEAENVQGIATYRLSVPKRIDISDVKIGSEINPSYNRYGKLESINAD